ncbi:hypothetical protein EVAR_72625_1 [Eumeta japonica]|uniref:Uncharacterized protein n=1 Tax=Eumeta variegata TaxID=151549 RepID=A0A4C2ACS8_EUMVA|nr:hypothetical protein EVAR_72625_1 [Eumeta japonica]
MGGAWERLVRSQNRVGRYIEREEPREEVLHTLLLEAEHIVNSRPLTERATLTTTCSRACKLAHVSAPRRSLLAEVVEEYLPTLVPAGARRPICRAPAEGDIVLIVDSSSPRYSWPRGRIKKTYPGPDNQVVWWTSRRLVAFCGVPLRRSSCWCQLRRRLFRVLKCSAAHRGENVTDSRAINLLANRHLVKLGLIKKSERKRCPLLIAATLQEIRRPYRRSVRIVKRGNGVGLRGDSRNRRYSYVILSIARLSEFMKSLSVIVSNTRGVQRRKAVYSYKRLPIQTADVKRKTARAFLAVR